VKTLLSIGDFIDFYYKLSSSGVGRIFYRLIPSFGKARTVKTWDTLRNVTPSNWWAIPLVHKRWNQLITGNSELEYPRYVVEKYLKDTNNLKLLSPGCGTGNKELKFAVLNNFISIEAFDLSPKRIAFANKTASQMSIKNINYFVCDVHSFEFEKEKYDVVVFDSFLHHIKNLDEILLKIYNTLKDDGILIINEYAGPSRFQWTKEQLRISNEALSGLPSSYRKRLANNKIKSKIYRPGLLRMILSDPSEAANSENILSKVKTYFKPLEEKPYGGNILHLILKDISQNFIELSDESIRLLNQLFEIEDKFLAAGNKSDFIFGVYSK
jgi:ubiquinone/menaquinone biosynthesis C-methylase UbiE